MSPDLAQQGTAYGDLADRRLTHLFGISDPTDIRYCAELHQIVLYCR